MIFLCFLLTSTGWLSWEYHLLDQISADTSDLYTMVAGYLLQAAGIAVFSALVRRRHTVWEKLLRTAIVVHMACMIPAVMSPYPAGTLVFGLLMNLVCGIIAGAYLYELACLSGGSHRASVFGAGYGLAILASYLLSLFGKQIYYSEKVLIIGVILTALTLFVSFRMSAETGGGYEKAAVAEGKDIRVQESVPGKDGKNDAESAWKTGKEKNLLVLAGLLVLLFSLVNSSGFAFPAADLGSSVNVELSRLFYAAGLVLAGYVTDKSRKYGAVCALAALVIPFVLLSLKGESVPVVIFWVLSYFGFGFYAVYRVILFSDMAQEKQLLFLAGAGLMIGRVGDALGEALCILLSGRLPILVGAASVLFAVTVAVFFKVYHGFYVPAAEPVRSEEEKFYQFSVQHDLSAREQDMLRLLLEKKTNTEISEALCLSENTVKFHVRNLLQKTGCKNRNELISVYKGDFTA